jgi:hypothetical protein
MEAPRVPKYCESKPCRCRMPVPNTLVRLYRVFRVGSGDWWVTPALSQRGGRRVRYTFRTSNKGSAWRFVSHLMKRVGGSDAQR